MDQDIDQLTHELRRMTDQNTKTIGIVEGMMRAGQQRHMQKSRRETEKASKPSRNSWEPTLLQEAQKSFVGAATTTGAALKLLGKDAGAAQSAFQNMVRNIPLIGSTAGVAIGSLAGYLTDLTGTYRDMTEVGQSFTGGIFEMATAAAAGRMSLEEFARNMKNFSVVAAQMGGRGKGLAQLSASVREGTEKFGMFGYSIEGMNDLVGTYMETMRLQNRLEGLSQSEASRSLQKLAQDTTTLSTAFGKSRKEITDASQGALRSAAFTSRMRMLSPDVQAKMGDGMQTAITALAAQAGDAGKILSNMLGETFGYGGMSTSTQFGQAVTNRIFPQMNMMMEEANRLIQANPSQAAEIANDMVGKLKNEIDRNMSTLNTLSAAGIKEADEIINLYANLKHYTPQQMKEMEAQAKQQSAITRGMMALPNLWARFSGSIREKLYPMIAGPMEAIAKGLENFAKSPAFEALTDMFATMGKKLTDWISSLVTDENMNALSNKVQELAVSFSSLLTGFDPNSWGADFRSRIASIDTEGIKQDLAEKWKTVVAVFDALASIKWADIVNGFNMVADGIRFLMNHFQEIATASALLLGAFVALKLGMAAKNFIGGMTAMSVKAGVVNVNGDKLSGAITDALGGGKDAKGKPKGGAHAPAGGGGKFGWAKKAFGFGAATVAGAAGLPGDALGAVGKVAGEAADTVKSSLTGAITEAAEAKIPGVAEGARGATGAAATAGEGMFARMKGLLGNEGLAGSIKGLASPGGIWSGIKGVAGFAAKAVTPLTAAVEGLGAYQDTQDAKAQWKNGEITDREYNLKLMRSYSTRAAGFLGGFLGGTGGAAVGSLAGPVGTAVGGAAGAFGGQQAGEWMATQFNDMLDSVFGPTQKVIDAFVDGPDTPMPANMSLAKQKEYFDHQNAMAIKLQNLRDLAANDSDDAKKMQALLEKLTESIERGNIANAGLLQKVTDTIRKGNREIANGFDQLGG